ncbi:MAG: hypothetical protein GY714_16555 [Desulfobacterales bacterium]|nr:hypothetical protein [Desulfobacterales bacterium]
MEEGVVSFVARGSCLSKNNSSSISSDYSSTSGSGSSGMRRSIVGCDDMDDGSFKRSFSDVKEQIKENMATVIFTGRRVAKAVLMVDQCDFCSDRDSVSATPLLVKMTAVIWNRKRNVIRNRY